MQAGLSKYALAALDPKFALGPAHLALSRYVPDRSRVLDIGCSSGYLAAALAQRGCRTVGVELEHADAELARRHCQHVIEGDVETLDLGALFSPESFDVIVFGDVLEHLRSPERVLSSVQRLLRPGGRVVVSIPNVAHASIRLQLLLGEFRYTPAGLLDETHVRFFTLASFTAMAWSCGFAVSSVTRVEEPINPHLWRAVVDELQLDQAGADRLAGFLAAPSATTFQYVLELTPRHPEMDPPACVERPAWTEPLSDYLAQRDDLIRSLQEQVAEQTAWAQATVEQVRDRDKTIRELQQLLAEQTAWAQSAVEQVKQRDEIIRQLRTR